MTDPTPSRAAAPLTAEEEASVRDWLGDPAFIPPTIGRGVSALEVLPRLLATLDAARASQPAPADPERVTCICGRSVLPQNWDNHLLSQKGRHGHPAPAGVRDPEPRPDLAAALDAALASLDEDDLMYDHPVGMSGEPMDPVLHVNYASLRAALTPDTHPEP